MIPWFFSSIFTHLAVTHIDPDFPPWECTGVEEPKGGGAKKGVAGQAMEPALQYMQDGT